MQESFAELNFIPSASSVLEHWRGEGGGGGGLHLVYYNIGINQILLTQMSGMAAKSAFIMHA